MYTAAFNRLVACVYNDTLFIDSYINRCAFVYSITFIITTTTAPHVNAQHYESTSINRLRMCIKVYGDVHNESMNNKIVNMATNIKHLLNLQQQIYKIISY